MKLTDFRQDPAISMLAENETGARVCDLTRGSITIAGMVLSTITRKWFPIAHQQKLKPSLNIPWAAAVWGSEAGRNLEEHALTAAVIASVRHRHTPYDEMLASGVDRQSARSEISAAIDRIFLEWRG